jgi:hypothetical protein
VRALQANAPKVATTPCNICAAVSSQYTSANPIAVLQDQLLSQVVHKHGTKSWKGIAAGKDAALRAAGYGERL